MQGSFASMQCGFCNRGQEVEDVCGVLWMTNDVAAHHKCMQYSACLTQYKIHSFGGFKINKVEEEIKRGRSLACHCCKDKKKKHKNSRRTGGTCGCAIEKCKRSFHFYCAKTDPKVITKRLEVSKKDGTKVVLYRVFCNKEHQVKYEKSAENRIDYVSDSDPDGDSDVGPDYHATPEKNDQFVGHPLYSSMASLPAYNLQSSLPYLTLPVAAPLSAPLPPPPKPVSQAKCLPSNPAINISTPSKPDSTTTTLPKGDGDSSSSDDEEGDFDLPTGFAQQLGHMSAADSDGSGKIKRTLGTITPLRDAKKPKPPIRKRHSPRHMSSKEKRVSDASSDSSLPPAKMQRLDSGERSNSAKKKKSSTSEGPVSTGSSQNGGLGSATSAKSKSTTVKGGEDKERAIDQMKLRVQANPEDCVICFRQSNDNSDNVSGAMQQMAQELYGVPHSSVYIWQYSSCDDTLTDNHMAYLLKDITHALSKPDFGRLERLVFDLTDSNISEYSNLVRSNHDLGRELEQKIMEKIQKQIDTYFVRAEALLKEDVGCILKSDELGGNVLFLRVCQVIDPHHVIRSRLGHQADLVQWDTSTILCNFDKTSLVQYQSHEKEILLKWLGKHVNSPQILSWPSEPIFLSKCPKSTTFKLQQDYRKKPTMSQSNSTLVFLGPVDEEVINFDMYVRKMLQQLMEERLSMHSKIYCVLDVGRQTGIRGYSDIIGKQLPPFADVIISSAQDPEKLPVTAVLVQITFKTDFTLLNPTASLSPA